LRALKAWDIEDSHQQVLETLAALEVFIFHDILVLGHQRRVIHLSAGNQSTETANELNEPAKTSSVVVTLAET